MTEVSSPEADVVAEFGRAELGDERRTRRLQVVARRALETPGAGFPQMVASDAELEGVYRLLSNEQVTPTAVLAPHVTATLERARQARHCLVVHDTTMFEFGGDSEREGLGLMIGNGQGFLGHFAPAVAPGDSRAALGVCGLEQWRRLTRKGSNHSKTTWKEPHRESLRWARMLEQVEQLRQKHDFSAIHVMDREADIFDLLATAVNLRARFVNCAAHDRALVEGAERVRERAATLEPVVEKRIQLGARGDAARPRSAEKETSAALGARCRHLRRRLFGAVARRQTLHARSADFPATGARLGAIAPSRRSARRLAPLHDRAH